MYDVIWQSMSNIFLRKNLIIQMNKSVIYSMFQENIELFMK